MPNRAGLHFYISGLRFPTLRVLAALLTLSLLCSTPAQSGVAAPPFVEEEVTIDHGDISLAGTLTLPSGEGPHAAFVTLTGSGQQDRDNAHESLPDYRPFRDLAVFLARRGVATLRFDDRGTGESTGTHRGATTADFASDAEAAIRYVLARDEIDPARIGLLGHSEGSAIAAMVAARDPRVAYVVSLAGASVRGYDLMLEQLTNLARVQTSAPQDAERVARAEIAAMDLALAGDVQALEEHLYRTYLDQFSSLPEAQRPDAAEAEAAARGLAAEGAAGVYTDPWYLYFLRHDPARDWARVTVPVLAVFAELDTNVPASQNRPALEVALAGAGNDDVTTVVVPDANHLFLESRDGTGNPLEYATLDMELVPELYDALASWLEEHVTTPR